MVGLDGGGKTTILNKLKFGKVVTTVPTVGFNLETFKFNGVSIKVRDVGDHGVVR